MRELTILHHKQTAMALTLGLVAVLMVSASFASGAYAQAGGHGGWLVGQIFQGQVNKAFSSIGQAGDNSHSSIGQAVNQVGKVLAGHLRVGQSLGSASTPTSNGGFECPAGMEKLIVNDVLGYYVVPSAPMER
jgi:hypothetical protein